MNLKLTPYFSILPVVLLTLNSCGKEGKSEFPAEPEITLNSTTGNVFNFSDETTGIMFDFSLRDGDKDMGLEAKDSVFVFEDYRSDTLYQAIYLGLPEIPRETINGPTLNANVQIPLRSFYFMPRPDSLHMVFLKDTLYFKIYAIDDAGNKSNVITTEPIYIVP